MGEGNKGIDVQTQPFYTPSCKKQNQLKGIIEQSKEKKKNQHSPAKHCNVFYTMCNSNAQQDGHPTKRREREKQLRHDGREGVELSWTPVFTLYSLVE